MDQYFEGQHYADSPHVLNTLQKEPCIFSIDFPLFPRYEKPQIFILDIAKNLSTR
jgi:hypothetical protein